jgi:hypothetical protein
MKEMENGFLRTHISGSFCISITAATGIPKFDAGPQKSAQGVSFILLHKVDRNDAVPTNCAEMRS